MSQDDVDVVRDLVEGESLDAARDETLTGFVGALAPDIEYVEDPRFPEAGTYRGRAELLDYFRQFSGQFEQFLFEIEDVLDAGSGTVLVTLQLQGRGGGSGAAFEARAGWVFFVEEGQVVRIRAYLDRADALEAVGLRE